MKDNAYRQDVVSLYQRRVLITVSIITMLSISHKLCIRLFTFS